MPEFHPESLLHESLDEIKKRFPEHAQAISGIIRKRRPRTAGQLLRIMEKEIPGFKAPEEWHQESKKGVELPNWLKKAAPTRHHNAIAEELARIREEREIARPGKLRDKLISRLEERGVSLPERALKKLSPAKLFSMLEEGHQTQIREHLLKLLHVPKDKWEYYTDISQLDREAKGIGSEPTAIKVHDNGIVFSGWLEPIGAEVGMLAEAMGEPQRNAFGRALAEWIEEEGLSSLGEEGLIKRSREIADKARGLAGDYSKAEAMTPKQYLVAAKKIKNRVLEQYGLDGHAIGEIGKVWNKSRKLELEEMHGTGVKKIIFTPAEKERLERRAHSLAMTHIATRQVVAALQERIGKSIHPKMLERIQKETAKHVISHVMGKVKKGEFGRLSDEEVAKIADAIAKGL